MLAFTAIFKSNNENIYILFVADDTGREIIRCIMTKERFTFLLRCIRFDNPNDRNLRKLTDPAAPITEIFNLFVKNCQGFYTIGTSACIDEMLVGFRGRSKFKMYIPNKPTKYGIKKMCLTDARNGYFYNGYIYNGKDSDEEGLPQGDKKYSDFHSPFINLAGILLKITFDNWFISLNSHSC